MSMRFSTSQNPITIPSAGPGQEGLMSAELGSSFIKGEAKFTLTDDGFGAGTFGVDIDATAFSPGPSDGGGPPSVIPVPLMVQWTGTLIFDLSDGSKCRMNNVFFAATQQNPSGFTTSNQTVSHDVIAGWTATLVSIVATVTKTSAVAKLHVGGTGPTIGLTGKVAWNLVQTLVYL